MYASRSHGCKVAWCTAGAFPSPKGRAWDQEGVNVPLERTQYMLKGKTQKPQENYPDVVFPLLPLQYYWKIILILALRVKVAAHGGNWRGEDIRLESGGM